VITILICFLVDVSTVTYAVNFGNAEKQNLGGLV